MPIDLVTIKTNYIPTSPPPVQGSLISIPNQTGANQTGTNNFVAQITDGMNINITPTGGLGNNHYSTASVDNRVIKNDIDVIKSTSTNLVAFTFNLINTGAFNGFGLIEFSKTFLLPNAFYEFELQVPLWFYLNSAPTPRYDIVCVKSNSPNFISPTLLPQYFSKFLLPNVGRQGQDNMIKFRDAVTKPAGTYYYRIFVQPRASFAGAGGTFIADLYCSETVTRNQTQYNLTNSIY